MVIHCAMNCSVITLTGRLFPCIRTTSCHRVFHTAQALQRQAHKSRQPRDYLDLVTKAKRPMAKIAPQKYDYFVVLDFEATCDKDQPVVPQEIIEFPMLVLNAQTFEVGATFHHYVQPRVHRNLTPFCTELTGIIQDMVANAQLFEDVLQNTHKFLLEQGLLEPGVRWISITCGDWDLGKMLPSQTATSKVNCPNYFNQWINLKKPYADVTGRYRQSMMKMLSGLNLKHIGRHHSGIDDCRNLANIVKALAEMGYVFEATSSLK